MRNRVPGKLCWLFRENLCVGAGAGRTAVTLSFQSFAPAVDESDARAVYEIAATSEDVLRFALLAATHDRLFATLCSDPGFVEGIELHREWQLAFQYEPSYHSFQRVDSPEPWRALKLSEPQSSEIDGVLVAHTRATLPNAERDPERS